MIRSGTASAYLLRTVRLLLEAYAGAELPQWEAVARTIRSVHLDPGDVLFSAGEVHPYVYYVEEGLLKAQMPDARGRTVITFFAEEGELLVSMPALAPEGVRQVVQRNLHPRAGDLQVAVQGVSIHTVAAIEPCVVHGFDYRLIDRLGTRQLPWSRLATALSMAYAITLQADAATLRNPPEQRYRQLLETRSDLIERISRRELAAYLAVTDVALSRIAKRVEAAEA
ncbi:MAG: Crp/Fnr family transcriptional regulator [Propionibacteriaceae bacterium]|nr:Crp/Fnr family transcriptional regulator [Propionibacteriaceae bacterium]